jgi:hypothetical protein
LAQAVEAETDFQIQQLEAVEAVAELFFIRLSQ